MISLRLDLFLNFSPSLEIFSAIILGLECPITFVPAFMINFLGFLRILGLRKSDKLSTVALEKSFTDTLCSPFDNSHPLIDFIIESPATNTDGLTSC